MADQIPPEIEDIGQVIQRIHQLGTATETLFSRLHASLRRQNKQVERQAAVAEITEQVQSMARRNRHLRQMINERDLEVERLQGILASISEGIIMQNTDGHIVMMNEVATRLLGSEAQFWDSELGRLFEEHRDNTPIGSELALLGEAKQVQIGQHLIGAQIIAIHDSDNQRVGTLMILRDITQDDLSRQMKKSFVTHISHELITPLAPMRVASEILLNTPEDQPVNRRMLTMISRNVDILDRMVRELLDMSAMTSGNFEVKQDPLVLEDLIWTIINDYAGDIREAELDITVMVRDASDLHVKGDEKYLTWAIGNLLRNAIQYNQPQEHIFITAALNPEYPEQIVVKVADTGVGISPEDTPNIFNLFYRGDARTQNGKKLDPRGLGQGLFVARTVAQAHGGGLYVDSTQYKGSTFTLTLPRYETNMALASAV